MTSLTPWLKQSSAWLALCLFLSGGTLVWVGYNAIAEWQRSALVVAQRRADAAADLLIAALTRDMRGVQATVLSSPRRDDLWADQPSAAQAVASAFARYPYPEAFFALRKEGSPSDVVFYSRADRRPTWLPPPPSSTRTPVVLNQDADTARLLLTRIARDAALRKAFSIFEVQLGESRYQVITLLTYTNAVSEQPGAIFGFLVNLDWVHLHYFQVVADQVARIANPDGGIVFTIFDEHRQPILTPVAQPSLTAGPESSQQSSRRTFPVAFFDPLQMAIEWPADLPYRDWVAVAAVSQDPTLIAANRWATRSLVIIGATAFVLAIGLVLAVGAARANASLALMRSEFVSAVTHELKTPVAALRGIGETLAAGRSMGPQMWQEYGEMAVQETKRLTLLIDNLLAYARITDVTDVYSFELIAVEELLDQLAVEYAARLRNERFQFRLDVQQGIPPIRVDRTAIELAFSNIIDNAIRYSKDRREISLEARHDSGTVTIEIQDRGIGIPPGELHRVRQRFWRGRHGLHGGAGLGLAITQRIVEDHHGTLTIESSVDTGTTVALNLPAGDWNE